MIATLKHFVAYNQTRGTGDVEDYFSISEHDVRVGERALREIYYPPFRAAVTRGMPARSCPPTTASTGRSAARIASCCGTS
ncbi:hypothetical protein [Halalkalicoccus salilacus]|uniref:hypothetical protein n=1 Tax=Halalkalicoccus sp. GCM10025704 TaxID=3252662 RepID=UPI003615168B